MENLNRKLIRSNKAQISFLCQYMVRNPCFAAGDYRSPMGAIKQNRQWEDLKLALNELGPARSTEQWKICWRDQKRKARTEAGALSLARVATGNVVPVPDLSENSALVLGAIGQEVAVGCGPEESPIGYYMIDHDVPLPSTSHQVEVEVEVAHSPQRQQSPAAEHQAVDRPRRRARRTVPPEQFLNAQLELNNLIKELIEEVRRSNNLREEHLNLLR